MRNEPCALPQSLALAALAFAASVAAGQPAPPPPPAGVKPIAVVNGEAISSAEVNAVIRLLSVPPGGTGGAQSQQLRREALELLMDDVLMRQYLGAHGQPVLAKEVDKRLAQLVAALKSQGRTLQDFLKETAQSEAHLRQDVQKKIQWDDLVREHLTDANLHRYYEQNRDFYDQVTVRASHILVRVAPNASAGEWQAGAQTLEGLRARIVAGQMDFSEAARKYSQCSSAPQGGDIGYFPRKWAVDEAVARAAFATKVGDVSPVVQSEIGLHLIKVTDRKPGQPSDLARIREKVVADYAGELWQTILAQERRKAQIRLVEP